MKRLSGGGSAPLGKRTKLDLDDLPPKPIDFCGLMETCHEEYEARQAAKKEAQRRAWEEAKAARLLEQLNASGKEAAAAAGVATGGNKAHANTATTQAKKKRKKKKKKKKKKAPGGGGGGAGGNNQENACQNKIAAAAATGGNTNAGTAKSKAKKAPGGGAGGNIQEDASQNKIAAAATGATGGNATEAHADIAKSQAEIKKKEIPAASVAPKDPLLVYHRLDPGTVSDETYLGFLQTDQNPPVKMYGTRKQGFYVARQLIARLNAGQIYEGERHLEDEPAVIAGLDGKEWELYQLTKEQMSEVQWKEVISSAKPSFLLEQAVYQSLQGHPNLRSRFKRNKCNGANFHHMIWKVNCHYSFDGKRRLVTIDRGTDGANAGCFQFPKDSPPYKKLYKLIVSTDADNLKTIRDTPNAYGVSQ